MQRPHSVLLWYMQFGFGFPLKGKNRIRMPANVKSYFCFGGGPKQQNRNDSRQSNFTRQ
jgi:hypothetical protein